MTTQTPSLDRHAARRSPHALRHTVMRWLKRGLLVFGAAAAIAALVWAWMPKPVAVDLAVVRRAPLEVTVEEDGKTRVLDRYVVAAPIAGNLQRIELRAGDPVARGAVVARIQPPDPALLDPRSREQATAQLAAALAHQRSAETSIVRARAARDSAARDADRMRTLAERQVITASEREHAELTEQIAEQDLAGAEQQRQAALAEVAAARAVLGQGGAPHGALAVTSPVAGQVLKVVRDSAGPVTAGAPLLELGDARALEIVVDVLSSDAARVEPGMAVAIAAWGGEGELAGRVTRVEPSAFTRISALGVEEQRVNLIIALDNAPPTLGDGFRVEARVMIWRGEALVAPASAVFRDHGRWAVYTVEAGRAHLRTVELGHTGRLDVEIASGLAPGTAVILHPGDRVADGTKVSATASADDRR